MCALLFLIDDDPIQHTLFTIQNRFHGLVETVVNYTDAQLAVNDLVSLRDDRDRLPDVILLDLSMPGMSGWDFLEEFERISPTLCKKIDVIIHTSSIDISDKGFSNNFPHVKGFLSKPLEVDHLKSFFSNLGHRKDG